MQSLTVFALAAVLVCTALCCLVLDCVVQVVAAADFDIQVGSELAGEESLDRLNLLCQLIAPRQVLLCCAMLDCTVLQCTTACSGRLCTENCFANCGLLNSRQDWFSNCSISVEHVYCCSDSDLTPAPPPPPAPQRPPPRPPRPPAASRSNRMQ